MPVIAFGYPSTLMLISNVALTEKVLQRKQGRQKQKVREGDLLGHTFVEIMLLIRNFNQLKSA